MAYFTIAEARAVRPLQDAVRYPDAAITAAREIAESALEDACGVPFEPRSFAQVVPARSAATDTILLPPRVLSITAASSSAGSIATTGAEFEISGSTYLLAGWPAGRITISGTHGYAVPPLRVKRAAILLTKRMLVDTPVNDRATQITNPDGTAEYFITAGRNGQPFDLPEANAVVNIYGILTGGMVA